MGTGMPSQDQSSGSPSGRFRPGAAVQLQGLAREGRGHAPDDLDAQLHEAVHGPHQAAPAVLEGVESVPVGALGRLELVAQLFHLLEEDAELVIDAARLVSQLPGGLVLALEAPEVGHHPEDGEEGCGRDQGRCGGRRPPGRGRGCAPPRPCRRARWR